MKHDLDPDGTRLPIRYDTTTNGEFSPLPADARQRAINEAAQAMAGEHARRLGLGRRAFLTSTMGAASVLTACNAANKNAGGSFALEKDAALDEAAADATLAGDEFIFDVQMHCVDPSMEWANGPDGQVWLSALRDAFPQRVKCDGEDFSCYSAETLAKEVFLDSDTDAGVVSALWGTDETSPTPTAYAAEARDVIDTLEGDHARCLIHGGVLANEPGEIAAMEAKVTVHGINAWKLYPQYGVTQPGYWLDDSEPAAAFFDEARRLGVTTVAVHKGISLFQQDPALSSPRDLGKAALANPDFTFLTYHSGFQPGVPEGPYNPDQPNGVDRLIRAHQDAGFARNEGNLYAEMGATWRILMGQPDQAAHYLGKLLKHFGEERILWGTDSLWFGSPQDQIQSFRAFEISEEYQERYGYPALTQAAKARIFGLNAAEVYSLDPATVTAGRLNEKRAAYAAARNPSFRTYGPKDRRAFLGLHAEAPGAPG
ncbi:amidohydrolase family protein [Sphingomicrobium sediminis]|uniref:Amidohydrolase n=1 Tax=Sphingomicrobium sediminis TaxID=2950949 RepID=A0A9X2ELQ6_9SPHN|nr:amidohydrolase family protein [Sphingomicrobium sediminis]MCM8557747.1 amidohydrolase [Sphingomicrobium sediminis]